MANFLTKRKHNLPGNIFVSYSVDSFYTKRKYNDLPLGQSFVIQVPSGDGVRSRSALVRGVRV